MVQNAAEAWRWPHAYASCPAGKKLVGGGGGCSSPSGIGWAFLFYDGPENDNTWKVACDTPQHQNLRASVFALCQ